MKKLPLVAALLGVGLVLFLQIATTQSHYFVFRPAPSHTGQPTPEHGQPPPRVVVHAPPPTVEIMQVCISAIVLGAGLWVVLSQRYQTVEKHWAYGAIGTIIGFWLKG